MPKERYLVDIFNVIIMAIEASCNEPGKEERWYPGRTRRTSVSIAARRIRAAGG